jgi:hypothetical protein
MKKKALAICVFMLCLVLTWCSDSKKADTLFIVAQDGVTTKGKVFIDLNINTGAPNIRMFAPGNIFVFRMDKEVKGLNCKAGFCYRVNKALELELIGPVDLKLSDDQLAEKFVKN